MKLLFCDFFSQHDKESVLIEQALQTFLGHLKNQLTKQHGCTNPSTETWLGA